MADPYVRQARGVFTGTVGSSDIKAGDSVYFDGTDWELADADDETTYAEAIVVNTVKSGEVGIYCRGCIIVDTDAPYTQGDQYFLSVTAGEITATRPTGGDDLKQVLGYGLSTTELYVDIQPVRELSVYVPFVNQVVGSGFDRDNDFSGLGLAAANDEVGTTIQVPQNAVGMEIAYLSWTGTGVVLDASDTFSLDVSGGIDDEATNDNSDGITGQALTVAASDISILDVFDAFNGSIGFEPGAMLGVMCKKTAEGTGGDDPIMCGITVVFKVV